MAQNAWSGFQPADPVWTIGDRFVDSQRPAIEPDGYGSADEVAWHRRRHLAAIRRAWSQADVFVFTFGLTEAFLHRLTGTIFPMAPGVHGGAFDRDLHVFHNYSVRETIASFEAFVSLARRHNPGLRFLITVSPVPLAATASGDHVEVATMRSKSILRAACDEIVQADPLIDYFPSYEIITSQSGQGRHYMPNLRDVSEHGVATVMDTLRASYGLASPVPPDAEDAVSDIDRQEELAADARCEEVLLNQFADTAKAP